MMSPVNQVVVSELIDYNIDTLLKACEGEVSRALQHKGHCSMYNDIWSY